MPDELEGVDPGFRPVDVASWKSKVRGRTVREFIRHKMTRQSAAEREAAMDGMRELLPVSTRDDVLAHVETVELMAHTQQFWQRDCADFFESIEDEVSPKMKQRGVIADDEDLFNAFEYICLALTRAVDTSRGIKGVAEIRTITRVGWWVIVAVVFLLVLYLLLR